MITAAALSTTSLRNNGYLCQVIVIRQMNRSNFTRAAVPPQKLQ
jgi:hypothetical protein